MSEKSKIHIAQKIFMLLFLVQESMPELLQKNFLQSGIIYDTSSIEATKADFKILAEAAANKDDVNGVLSHGGQNQVFDTLAIISTSIAEATPEQINKLNTLADIFGINPKQIL
jgi:hypothetical protein